MGSGMANPLLYSSNAHKNKDSWSDSILESNKITLFYHSYLISNEMIQFEFQFDLICNDSNLPVVLKELNIFKPLYRKVR